MNLCYFETMKRCCFFISLFLITIVSTGQTPKAVALLDSLLSPGTFTVAVTIYAFPAEVQVLQDSIIARLNRNPSWAGKNLIHLIGVGDYRNLKYMNEYGITREEYNLMMTAFKKGKQPIYGDKKPITIYRKNGALSFKTSGKAGLLNFLTINSISSTMAFSQQYMEAEFAFSHKFYAPSTYGFETHSSNKLNLKVKKTTETEIGGVIIAINEGDGKPVIGFMLLEKNNPTDIAKPLFVLFTIF